jgi:hypothetical protein
MGQVINKEKLDEIGGKLEYSPQTSIRYLAKETGVLKASARTSAKLLKFKFYNTTVFNWQIMHNLALA